MGRSSDGTVSERLSRVLSVVPDKVLSATPAVLRLSVVGFCATFWAFVILKFLF